LAFAIGVALALAGAPAASAQTIVSLTFDDGAKSQYNAAVKHLAPRGMRGTFYLNSSKLGSGSYYMTWGDVAALAAGGNEVGGHTRDHRNLTQVSEDTARDQICGDREALMARGYRVTDFAYPFGAFDSDTQQLVEECGYDTARRVGGLQHNGCSSCELSESIPPEDPFAMRTNPYIDNRAMNLNELKGWVTQAEDDGGGWVPLMFHDVCNPNQCPSGAESASVSDNTLAMFLDWLGARAVRDTVVKTVRQVMRGDDPLPEPPLPVTAFTQPPAPAPQAAATKAVCIVPKLGGVGPRKAKARLKKAGCRYRIRGRGRVRKTFPKAGESTTGKVLVRLKRRARR
jgi:peptidoglycan/xylan/chitin deacetylase (PgdA/CDA1 family)